LGRGHRGHVWFPYWEKPSPLLHAPRGGGFFATAMRQAAGSRRRVFLWASAPIIPIGAFPYVCRAEAVRQRIIADQVRSIVPMDAGRAMPCGAARATLTGADFGHILSCGFSVSADARPERTQIAVKARIDSMRDMAGNLLPKRPTTSQQRAGSLERACRRRQPMNGALRTNNETAMYRPCNTD
jgi:hypothetical protein